MITLSKPITKDKVFGEEGKKIQLHFFCSNVVIPSQLITRDEVFGEKMFCFKCIYFNSKIGLRIKVHEIRPPKLETRFYKGLKP
jgi:hypothetical protein